MGKYSVFAISLFLLIPSGALYAEKLPKAGKTPTPPSDAQEMLIREGIALHDAGNYNAAIAKYNQVLQETDGVVEVRHSS